MFKRKVMSDIQYNSRIKKGNFFYPLFEISPSASIGVHERC